MTDENKKVVDLTRDEFTDAIRQGMYEALLAYGEYQEYLESEEGKAEKAAEKAYVPDDSDEGFLENAWIDFGTLMPTDPTSANFFLANHFKPRHQLVNAFVEYLQNLPIVAVETADSNGKKFITKIGWNQ